MVVGQGELSQVDDSMRADVSTFTSSMTLLHAPAESLTSWQCYLQPPLQVKPLFSARLISPPPLPLTTLGQASLTLPLMSTYLECPHGLLDCCLEQSVCLAPALSLPELV